MKIGTLELDDKENLYEFLEVSADAGLGEIKRQYRQKALRCHPDKNASPQAAMQFARLSVAYEVLSDSQLRRQYDETVHRPSHDDTSIRRQRFQEELRSREHHVKREATSVYDEVNAEFVSKYTYEQTVAKLREEGLRLRRLHEAQHMIRKPAKKYVSWHEIKLNERHHYLQSRASSTYTVLVRWKHKSELQGLFTSDVLAQIMRIFGTVTAGEIHPTDNDAKYDWGEVEFANESGYRAALKHDYRHSARIWDGTPVRKLASLLRECKPKPGSASPTRSRGALKMALDRLIKST